MVMPVGPLMTEHRLIEQMIDVMKKGREEVEEKQKIKPELIHTVVDFIRVYADRLHHGKEEDILFRELEKKNLSSQHKKTMEELVEEHKWGRKKVKMLVESHKMYRQGDHKEVETISQILKELIVFYPKHIEKEDKNFFIPVMDYFSSQEQQDILEEERKFDREFIHQIYKGKVEEAKKIIS